jgi:HK97 family phage major capsid protein
MTEEEKLKLEEKDKDKKETIQAIAQAITPAVLEEFRVNKALRKNIHGDGSTSERQELADQKAQAAEFFKAMVQHDVQRTKALSAGTATSGLELVPTIVADQLITVAQKYGLARKYARKWPMQGNINEDIPTITTVTAFRSGTDTSSIQSSIPATGKVSLRSKTVGVIVPISKVLLQAATVDLVDAIVDLAGKALAKIEDQWLYLGLASNEGLFQTTGVPVATLASGGTTYKGVQAESLLDVIDQVDENFIGQNMRWIFSYSLLNNFRRLRAAYQSGGNTYLQGFLLENLGGGLPSTLWDIPYDTSAVMPKNSDGSQTSKKFLSLVDYDNVIMGDAKQYTTEMSDQATILDTDNSTLLNMFQQNMVAVKIWGLVDIQLANAAKAHANLQTAAS